MPAMRSPQPTCRFAACLLRSGARLVAVLAKDVTADLVR